jgi:hypothetical protein
MANVTENGLVYVALTATPKPSLARGERAKGERRSLAPYCGKASESAKAQLRANDRELRFDRSAFFGRRVLSPEVKRNSLSKPAGNQLADITNPSIQSI